MRNRHRIYRHEACSSHEKAKVEAMSLEELVVQNKENQENEADDDAYGNQFLLFGPAAQKTE